MADTESRQNVTGVRNPGGTQNVPCSARNVHSRPRLGEAHDSWATVFKDMLREAPKTGLVILATLVMAVINAITYLCVVLAGSSFASPLRGMSIRWLLGAVLELLRR